MGGRYDRSMPARQRRRFNRLCGEEAISRRKTYYTGFCAEHGEVMFKVHKCGLRWWPQCTICDKNKDADLRLAKTDDKEDLLRRRRNRVILLEALKNNIKHIEMECKHHQRTMFDINGITQQCIKCRNIKRRRLYKERKEQANASLDNA